MTLSKPLSVNFPFPTLLLVLPSHLLSSLSIASQFFQFLPSYHMSSTVPPFKKISPHLPLALYKCKMILVLSKYSSLFSRINKSCGLYSSYKELQLFFIRFTLDNLTLTDYMEKCIPNLSSYEVEGMFEFIMFCLSALFFK